MKRVGIDIGGTFTDLVYFDENSRELSRWKVLTSSDHPDESVLKVLQEAGIDPSEIALFLHGTTLATNLLIQRSGANVGLLTTLGFRDLLDIQMSTRPEPFNFIDWHKPIPLVPRERRLEVNERMSHTGEILRSMDEEETRQQVRRLAELGVQSVAVCFLHSFVNPTHELRAAEIVTELMPDTPISLSHEVDPTLGEYERTCSTVTNSYVQPATHDYFEAMEKNLPVGVRYMHSGGGVIPSDTAKRFPVMLISSGPAAGVLAGVFLAKQGLGSELITFDMGGTSTDVALIRDGQPEMRDSIEIDWKMPARTLAIDVSSVGAGGGSIASVDAGGALRVGPQSAGSSPGPVCYGLGGSEPTVTDANLCLGLIPKQLLGGRLTLKEEAARASLEKLGTQLDMGPMDAARAIYRIVNATMALATRQITVVKGIDPREFKLVAFGGAGGQHAVAVAEELGIRTVIFAPQASTFSAMGMLTADLTMSQARTLYSPFESVNLEDVKDVLKSLAHECAQNVESDVRGASAPLTSGFLDMRYVGQNHHVSVVFDAERDDNESMTRKFEDSHERLYGTRLGDPVELVNVRAVVRRELPPLPVNGTVGSGDSAASSTSSLGSRWVELERAEVPVVSRDSIARDVTLEGPVLIEEVDSAHFIPRGWVARLEALGSVQASQVD